MARRVLLALSLIPLLAACSGEVEVRPGADEPAGEPRDSEVVLQAVDAGTGAALADQEMTVRYLVRSPITLTATSVERVPAARPYRIRHRVGRDSLVVEVRLEAPSYHRLDTALGVARGGASGPHTIRMARRLESGGGGARPPSRETAAATPAPPPGGGGGSPGVQGAPSTGPVPADEPAGFADYLRMAEARCDAGRAEEGLRILARIARARQRMPEETRRPALLLVQYQRGVCLHRQFEAAEGPVELVRSGGQAARVLERFVEGGEALAPRPPALDSALADARARIEAIRERLRAAGRGS